MQALAGPASDLTRGCGVPARPSSGSAMRGCVSKQGVGTLPSSSLLWRRADPAPMSSLSSTAGMCIAAGRDRGRQGYHPALCAPRPSPPSPPSTRAHATNPHRACSRENSRGGRNAPRAEGTAAGGSQRVGEHGHDISSHVPREVQWGLIPSPGHGMPRPAPRVSLSADGVVAARALSPSPWS